MPFFVAVAMPLLAQPEPASWSQFQGDPAHTGATSQGPLPPYRRAWRYPVAPEEGRGVSAPIIAGELAITVGPSAVHALGLSSGEEVWTIPREPGPTTPPAVGEADGKQLLLYTEGDSKEASRLLAIDLASENVGSDDPVWEVSLDAVTFSGVTIEGSTAFVGDDAGTIRAIDLATGDERWTAELGAGIQNPVAASGTVVVAVAQQRSAGSAGAEAAVATVVALDRETGEREWVHQPQFGSRIGSVPSLSGDLVFVAFGDRPTALAADGGVERWGARTVGAVSPLGTAAVSGDSVYVADVFGGLFKLGVSTGARSWDFQFNETVARSSPVVIGGSAEGAVVLGLGDSRLAAVDPVTGHQVWEADTGSGEVGAIAVGPEVLVAAVGGADGGLVAFEPDPSGSLIDIPSPSEVDPGRLIGNFAIAVAFVTVALILPFRYLAGRMGPAEVAEVTEVAEVEGLEEEEQEEPGDGRDEDEEP